jgi:hypothetical protein
MVTWGVPTPDDGHTILDAVVQEDMKQREQKK